MSSKFMLSLPHLLVLINILDEVHTKLKYPSIKEKPCIRCRYQWHEPRTETIVAKAGIHQRASPESL
jgi:hypothetical protein